MRNKREIEILMSACFLACNHTEELMSKKLSIKSKTAQADCPGNRSNAFDMQIAEPMFEFCHSLPIPIAFDHAQWNHSLGNIADILHNVRISLG